jgi:hypothetical protein
MHVSIEVDDRGTVAGDAAPTTAITHDHRAHDGAASAAGDEAVDGGEPSAALLAAVAAAADGEAPGGTGSPEGLPGPDAAVIDAGPAPA